MLVKNQLWDLSTTLPTQRKTWTWRSSLARTASTHEVRRRLVPFPAFRSSGVTERKKAASDDTSLPSQNQATFRLAYLSCGSTGTPPFWQQTPQEWRKKNPLVAQIDNDGRQCRSRDANCTQDYESHGSRVTRSISLGTNGSPDLWAHCQRTRDPGPILVQRALLSLLIKLEESTGQSWIDMGRLSWTQIRFQYPQPFWSQIRCGRCLGL